MDRLLFRGNRMNDAEDNQRNSRQYYLSCDKSAQREARRKRKTGRLYLNINRR